MAALTIRRRAVFLLPSRKRQVVARMAVMTYEDVETWSQLRRGSLSARCHLRLPKEKQSCITQCCWSVPKLLPSSSRATCNAQSVNTHASLHNDDTPFGYSARRPPGCLYDSRVLILAKTALHSSVVADICRGQHRRHLAESYGVVLLVLRQPGSLHGRSSMMIPCFLRAKQRQRAATSPEQWIGYPLKERYQTQTNGFMLHLAVSRRLARRQSIPNDLIHRKALRICTCVEEAE